MDKGVTIFVLSDSIGETAEQVARAAASQFEHESIQLRRFPHVRTKNQIENILAAARPHNTLILFTIVIEELQTYLLDRAKEYKVRVVNVIGATLEELSTFFNHQPESKPGILRRVDDFYFDKISAIEFAVNYDDGKQLQGIEEADLILLGVSRTSKTPLSMYLALKHYKVANFPIVNQMTVPDIFFSLPKEKILGLTADTYRLNMIRKERIKLVGLRKKSDYADIEQINEEIVYANNIFKKIGCKVFDVSKRAIEETATLILNYLEETRGCCNLEL